MSQSNDFAPGGSTEERPPFIELAEQKGNFIITSGRTRDAEGKIAGSKVSFAWLPQNQTNGIELASLSNDDTDMILQFNYEQPVCQALISALKGQNVNLPAANTFGKAFTEGFNRIRIVVDELFIESFENDYPPNAPYIPRQYILVLRGLGAADVIDPEVKIVLNSLNLEYKGDSSEMRNLLPRQEDEIQAWVTPRKSEPKNYQ